jgi:hypothetical protein
MHQGIIVLLVPTILNILTLDIVVISDTALIAMPIESHIIIQRLIEESIIESITL